MFAVKWENSTIAAVSDNTTLFFIKWFKMLAIVPGKLADGYRGVGGGSKGQFNN